MQTQTHPGLRRLSTNCPAGRDPGEWHRTREAEKAIRARLQELDAAAEAGDETARLHAWNCGEAMRVGNLYERSADDGTATAGYGGTATAGYGGTATAGYGGTATAGEGGTAVVLVSYRSGGAVWARGPCILSALGMIEL